MSLLGSSCKVKLIIYLFCLFSSQSSTYFAHFLVIIANKMIWKIVIVTHVKFRGISGISTDFSYIGQCDLINTCFGLLQVWYTPGAACVGYVP